MTTNNRLRSTYMIGNVPVEDMEKRIGPFRLFEDTSEATCNYDPCVTIYFVDDQGTVAHTLSLKASGGPEGSCCLGYDFLT